MKFALHRIIDYARVQFESRFSVYPEIGNWALSPTGEEYVVVSCESSKGKYTCVKEWLSRAESYAAGKNGILYWRCHPEMEQKGNLYRIYSRLLVSENPQINPAVISGPFSDYKVFGSAAR